MSGNRKAPRILFGGPSGAGHLPVASAPAGDDLVCDCQQWPMHVSNECPVHNLFPDPPPEPVAPAGEREAAEKLLNDLRYMCADGDGAFTEFYHDDAAALAMLLAALSRARTGSEAQ